MYRIPKPLVATTQLTNAAATYYTADANTRAEITQAVATNVTGTARTVTVYLVPLAGTAGATNIVVQTMTVPANSSVQLWQLLGLKMLEGGFIQALADANTAVNLSIGGYEVS